MLTVVLSEAGEKEGFNQQIVRSVSSNAFFPCVFESAASSSRSGIFKHCFRFHGYINTQLQLPARQGVLSHHHAVKVCKKTKYIKLTVLHAGVSIHEVSSNHPPRRSCQYLELPAYTPLNLAADIRRRISHVSTYTDSIEGSLAMNVCPLTCCKKKKEA